MNAEDVAGVRCTCVPLGWHDPDCATFAGISDLRDLFARAKGCHGLVIRDGIEDACDKPAVAIIDARDTEDGCYWPACAYHAHRYGRGRCVPLAELRRARAGSAG